MLTAGLARQPPSRAPGLRGDKIPTYETPDDAVTAFMYLRAYGKNQELLLETPLAHPGTAAPDREVARKLVAEVLAIGRPLLTEPEAKSVLQAYAVPTVDTRTARDPAEAARIAAEIGRHVAIKILSPISFTNRMLAACALICLPRRSRALRARCSTRSTRGRSGASYRLLHRRDDQAAASLRAACRDRRRSRLRSSDPVWPRRHGRRNHSRSRYRAATAQPPARARSDRPHACGKTPRRLPRPPSCRDRRGSSDARQAVTTPHRRSRRSRNSTSTR